MKSLAVLLLLAVITAPVTAQDDAAAAWRSLAATDSEAAFRLIEQNHPGAVPALGDTEFLDLLRTARSNVEARLPRVTGYDGYAALMAGLATDFRDGHIWSTPLLQKTQRTWAGLIIVRQGGQWIVGHQDTSRGETAVAGARLVGCDGVDAETWAKQRVGMFRGDPRVEAQLAASGPWLLLDDANPFLTRPTECTFRGDDASEHGVRLSWRGISTRALETAVGSAYERPRAGMSVTAFEGGQWIALETLGSAAADVVAQVERQADALRAAPMVVLDLRGNGGGNSAFANAIARTLIGEDALAAVQASLDRECAGQYWRVSDDNLAALRRWRASIEQRVDAPTLAGVDELIIDVERALDTGGQFAPALPACAPTAHRATLNDGSFPATAAMTGRLIVLTDRHCFSSCLIAVGLFRQLGATHVGEATDLSTRYMEVREITLPSGLRTFSTLQKVTLGIGDFGPYEPHVPYPGPLADTAALKAWVAALR
jgi:hypothetical protein